MPRDISSEMREHLDGDYTTRALMMRLDLRNGVSVGLTDHDRDIPGVLIGDGSDALDYYAGMAILPTQLELTLGTGVDDIDVTGIIDDEVFTRARLLGGTYANATVKLFEVNWKDLSMGVIPYMKGLTAKVNMDEDEFKLIVQSETTKLAQTKGRIISPYCDAVFGDSRCTKIIPPLAATVTAAYNNRQVEFSYTGEFIDDFFNKGTLEFTTGPLAGTRRVEVFDWFSYGSGGGYGELWTRLPSTPGVGDTVNIYRGCGNTIQECVAYANGVNFRGFPYVPGRDRYLRMPLPGGG